MRLIKSGKQQFWRVCGLCFCLGIIILGAVCCGMGRGIPYQAIGPAAAQCQSGNALPTTAGEQTLAVVVQAGPNITLCLVRASDGAVLRHFDLTIYGNVAGYGAGLLFVNERVGVGGSSLALCAVYVSDGVERWCQPQLTNAATVNVADGNVYASSIDQTLVTALSARDGRILWHFQTLAPSSSANPNLPMLTTSPGLVYVNSAPEQAGSPTPDTAAEQPPNSAMTRKVCALRASDGRQLWCHTFLDEGIATMTVDAHTLYIRTSNDFMVYALDTTNGSVRWAQTITWTNLSSPTTSRLHLLVAGGRIFIDAPGADTTHQNWSSLLYALNASNGQRIWKIAYPGLSDSLSATDTLVSLVLSTGKLETRNALDGTPAWSYSVAQQATPVTYYNNNNNTLTASIVTIRDVTYMLTYTQYGLDIAGTLLAIHAKSGTPIWQMQGCTTNQATQIAATSTPVARNSPAQCYWTLQGQYNATISLFAVTD